MEAIRVAFKKLVPEAVTPTHGTEDSAGLDLTATSKQVLHGNILSYGTGLALEIPKGYMGLIFPRSSVAKTTLDLANAVGVVDADYRGEIVLNFRQDFAAGNQTYEVGDRIGQIIIVPFPQINLWEVKELETSDRGEKGFGSTGK